MAFKSVFLLLILSLNTRLTFPFVPLSLILVISKMKPLFLLNHLSFLLCEDGTLSIQLRRIETLGLGFGLSSLFYVYFCGIYHNNNFIIIYSIVTP